MHWQHLCLVLMACTLCNEVAVAAKVTDVLRVETPQQLLRAMRGRATAVHITRHLDLRGLPESTVTKFDELLSPELFTMGYQTQAVTGRCPDEIPESMASAAGSIELQQGQCLLLTNMTTFSWWGSASAANDVWFHGLYMLAQPSTAWRVTSFIYWRPSTVRSSMWLTEVTLDGGKGCFTAFSPAYAEGLNILDAQVQSGGAATVNSVAKEQSATLAMHGGIVAGNRNVGLLATKGGLIFARNVEFTDNRFDVGPHYNRSRIFTDAAFAEITAAYNETGSETGSDNGEVLSLDQAQRANFLQGDDTGFLRLRQDVHRALGTCLHGQGTRACANVGGGDNSLSAGAIAGIVVAVVLVAVALHVVFIFFLCQRRRRQKGAREPSAFPQQLAGVNTSPQVSPSSAPEAKDSSARHFCGGDLTHDTIVAPLVLEATRSLDNTLEAVSGGGISSSQSPATDACAGNSGVVAAHDAVMPLPEDLAVERRVVPPQRETSGLSTDGLSMLSVEPLRTRDQPEARGQLLTALENLASREPPAAFAGRYMLLREHVEGGQAIVYFARDARGGPMQYALKFYYNTTEFEEEAALYRDPTYRSILPSILHAHANSNQELCSPSGFVFPPFIVLERGLTMSEWAQHERGFFEVCSMLESIAKLLQTLHESGRVHRDIKPPNVLYLLQSACWRLIDVGIVGRIGEHMRPRCTLAYCPPEVVLNMQRNQDILVEPSHDVWALAVCAYESIVQSRALYSVASIADCATGAAPYPWELPPAQQAAAWRRSRMRRILAPCLARDVESRPSAGQLLQQVARIGHVQTPEEEMQE